MQQQTADVADGKQIKPWLFQPGVSGNPKGRPLGGRNRLEDAFVIALADSFDRRGAEAIERCIDDDPVAYIKVIASLLPKDARIEINRSLTGLTPDELLAGLALIRAAIEARGSVQSGPEPAAVIDVQALPETS